MHILFVLFLFTVVQLILQFRILRKIRAIKFIILDLKAALQTSVSAASMELYTIIDGQITKVDKMNLKVTQKVPLIVVAKDKKGNVVGLDGAPEFKSSDESLGVIEKGDDGTVYLNPVGPLGALTVSVDADGDLGEGVKPLHFEGAVNLIAGDAEVLDLQFGAPIDN